MSHTRKPPIPLPIPEDRRIAIAIAIATFGRWLCFCGSSRENSNRENTPRARNQRDLADICVKCGEEFLGELLSRC